MFKYLLFACLPIVVLADKYAEGTNVIRLNWTNFDKLVLQSDQFWLIKCHESMNRPLTAFVNEFEKTAIALKGLVNVGEIHVNANEELLRKFGVVHLGRQGPIFLIFSVDKTRHDKYYGTVTPRHLVDYMFATIKRRANLVIFDEEPKPRSIDVTGDVYYDILHNTQPWVLAFLLTSDNTSAALYDWWDQIAVSLHGRAKVGHYDALMDNSYGGFIQRLHSIVETPTIKCFPKGSKTDRNLQTYHGNISFDNVLDWALNIVDESTEIAHLTNELMYKDYCQMKMCIIFFLPNLTICPTLCRHDQLKKLAHTAKNFEDHHWSWLWVEGGEQPHLEEVFKIEKGIYPTMAGVNNFKQTYASLKGSFFGADIEEFLRQLSKKDTIVTPFNMHLAITSVGKWFPFEHDEL